MKREEKPVLQVQHLTVRYGEGCPCCQTHLEKNRCTVCGTVWVKCYTERAVDKRPKIW